MDVEIRSMPQQSHEHLRFTLQHDRLAVAEDGVSAHVRSDHVDGTRQGLNAPESHLSRVDDVPHFEDPIPCEGGIDWSRLA